MKKQKPKYLDILILLGFLLLLSAGISLLAKAGTHAVDLNEDKTILNQLSPLFMAGNSKKIAEFISQKPQPQQLRLVSQILDDQKNPLEVTDKIKLILELARKNNNQNYRISLYNTLIENEQVAKQKPLLYIAAQGNYEDLLESIAQWLKGHTDIFAEWFYSGMHQAIKENKPDIANKLLTQFSSIPLDIANKLLWEVINEKKSSDCLVPLIKKGADINNPRHGRTPLIAAVEAGQMPLVEVLLKNGAQVNIFVDPAVGTALQTAIRKKYTNIELLLRKNGARE